MSTSALLPALVLLPLVGALCAVAVPRAGFGIARLVTLLTLPGAIALAIFTQDAALTHRVGGWGAPLGIDLYADRAAALLLMTTTVIYAAVGEYAGSYFTAKESRRFWSVWLLLQTSLHGLFLAHDLFNLYVNLELLSLSAVALTALSSKRTAQQAALKYLFASLAGSLAYLLGVALVYREAGSLDLSALGDAAASAKALMLAGMLLKAAVFPLHFWLPSAHGSAPTPVSAVLSALAVKAPLYIVFRLLTTGAASAPDPTVLLLQGLGCAAVIWCSVQALVQSRAKVLVAYSTAAQLGYLVLALSLLGTGSAATDALFMLVLAHALAKAAMFMAVGNVMTASGSDRIQSLDDTLPSMPLSTATMALAAVSLMGLPPSGGFLGKWRLLGIAIDHHQWLVVTALLAGTLLATAYCFRLLQPFFSGRRLRRLSVAGTREWSAFTLAAGAVLLGFAGAHPLLTGVLAR